MMFSFYLYWFMSWLCFNDLISGAATLCVRPKLQYNLGVYINVLHLLC